MARTYTRAEIRARAQAMADDEDGVLLTDAQYDILIDESLSWLYDELIDGGVYPEVSEYSLTDSSPGTWQSISTDTYAVLAVQYQYDGDHWVNLQPMHMHDWAKFDISTGQEWSTRFLLNGLDQIRLFPQGTAGKTYRIIYVPAPDKLASDAATINGVNGWEMLIVYDVAIKAKIREDASTKSLENERDRVLARLAKVKHRRLQMHQEVPESRHGLPWMDAASVRSYRRF